MPPEQERCAMQAALFEDPPLLPLGQYGVNTVRRE